MPGTRANANPVRRDIGGYSAAAVTASQILSESVMTYTGRVIAVKALAAGAGSGAGNTVLDVLRNGTTIWSTATQRPTLATGSTGEFTNGNPDRAMVRPGDRITVQVATIPASTGHTGVVACVTIGLPA